MTQPIKLLFVDDDRHVLKSLLRLFYDEDYEVYGVLSGEEGLDILGLHPDIKIVVSDYMMPVMTGVEFLKKAAQIAPNVVRIILTEHEETKVLLAAINEGLVYKFILKPWDNDDLKITIANAAERYALLLQNRQLLDELAASNKELRSLNDRLECRVEERTAQLLKFETAIKGTQDWVLITDVDGVITYANQSVYDISGYAIDALIGQKPSIWKSGSHDETFYKNLWECILAGQPFRHVFINKKANSELFLLDNTISPIRDEQGTIKAFVSSGKDITKQKYLEDRLAYLAYYDPVTDMPNKSLFCDRLDMSIARIKHHERLVAIMIVGTDNFGMLIDTLGHDNTDKILVELACRLKGSVRDGDTVSRLGTNDFGLALNDIASKDDIPLLIEKIRSVLEKPIHVASEVFRVSTSIGISICPDDAQTVQELMRNAYLSLSHARRAGGNTFKFYSPEMNKMATEFVNMETRLLKAIDNKGFVLHYQPYFDVATDEIKGAESLLRLKSDDLGLIMPARFIHVLEETGLIVKAGEWVLEEVIAQLGRWQLEGRALVPVTLNLSAVQFRTKDLCRCIRSSMAAADVDPRILSFEITESAFIQDLDASVEAIDELKALGVNILIDDFGTAYSSLNYLSRFNVDYLKIDMSFIRGITTRKSDEAIVRAIIAMAHSLNMKTIAEGVETEEQLHILRHLECDMVQGFLFSKPIPPEDLAAKYLTGCF